MNFNEAKQKATFGDGKTVSLRDYGLTVCE